MMGAGKDSTEHRRALRAEMLGAVLALAGAGWALASGSWPAVALAGIGAATVTVTAAAYGFARSAPKAAAVRRPADQAPRSI